MDNLKEKKDEEIVKMVLENSDFYSEIISRYQNKIGKYISRISAVAADDVDDLTQDVFLSAYENINSYNSEFSFSSWIYRIAHNKTINFWKKRKREFGSICLEDNMFIVDSVFFENSVEMDIEKIENKEMIEKILECMSDKYRDVLVLKFLEHKDYNEMSDILQKPMGTIATLVNRAKKQFKDKMEKMESEFYEKKKFQNSEKVVIGRKINKK